ncbi:MAG TPA: endolytic transglycosylase MltG [Gammaproteobacteria bacterium]
MTRALKVASLAALLAVGGAGAAGVIVWRTLQAPLPVAGESVAFEVATGTPLARLAANLNAEGVLPHPRLLTWYARLTGDAVRIQAGEYRLQPGTSSLELLRMLVDGNVVTYSLTVVEGWRFADLRAALRAHPAIVPLDLEPAEIMAELGSPGLHPEGQFLPDTYVFPKGTPELVVLRSAHEALQTTLEAAWQARDPQTVLTDPYSALILASIIEKETALPAERGKISGVFQQRLARGMRLQTDPTVIYGLGESFDGNLRRRDLARDTPYNTYTRRGLPPTPIALPSAASIEAAVKPELTDALYFVATGEPDGGHRFSATIDEHNEAVRAYLERLEQEP